MSSAGDNRRASAEDPRAAGQQGRVLARIPAVGGLGREPSYPEAWTAAAVETLPLAPLQPPSGIRTDRALPASGPASTERIASRFETESIAAGLSAGDAASWCLRIDAAATSVFEAPLPTPTTTDLREVEGPASLPFERGAGVAAREHASERKPAAHFRVDPPAVRFDKHAGVAAEKTESWADRLCQLQASAAPYAGLIVTLALIVSAGLLYWLVLGPTSAALPTQEVPNEQLTGGMWDWESTTSSAPAAQASVARDSGAYPYDAFTINALPSEAPASPAGSAPPAEAATAASDSVAAVSSPPAVVVDSNQDAPSADPVAASPYPSTPYPAYEFYPRGFAPDMAVTPTPSRR